MKLLYKIEIIWCVFFAHLYAVLERLMDPAMTGGFLSSWPLFPFLNDVVPYHYFFMPFIVFFPVAFIVLAVEFFKREVSTIHRLALIGFAWTNVFLIAFIEDMAYFYLFGTWMSADLWSANVIGYTSIGGIVIPYSYFLFSILIVISYAIGWKHLTKD